MYGVDLYRRVRLGCHRDGLSGREAAGRFGIDRFVDIVSTNPARLFGLYPQKGTIAAGSDADIVIWDPEAEMVMTKPALHSAVDYTLFEGMPVKGLPRTVFLRGEMIVDGDRWLGRHGSGAFLKRGETVMF